MGKITFNEIASNYKVPGAYVEIDERFATSGLIGKESVGLIIGQKASTAPAEYNKIYQAYEEDEVIEQFGEGSEIHRIAKVWTKNNNYNVLKIIAVEQKTGQAATYNLEIAAEDTKAGQINLMIAGQQVKIEVEDGTTAKDLAAALLQEVNNSIMIPVIASAVEGEDSKILLTAKCKGEAYNNLKIRLNYYAGQKTATGVTVTIAKGTEGSGNASLMSALAALGGEYFTDGITNYFDDANIRLLRDIMEERFTALVNNPGTIHIGFYGTYSELITKAAAINSPHFVIHPAIEGECLPAEFAAASAALIAYRSQMMPGLLFKGLKLKGILPGDIGFDPKERNLLLNNGISTVYRDTAGNLYLERPVTTYTKKSNGQKTETYLDVSTIKLVAYLRYSLIAYMDEQFPDFKLADDGFPIQPGQNVATPLAAKAAIMAWGKMCQRAALIESLEDVMCERNDTDLNRIDGLVKPNLINNLMSVALKLQQIN